jgi:hypothetical protein
MILLATHRAAVEVDRVVDGLRSAGAETVRVNMAPGESRSTLRIGDRAAAELSIMCDGRSIQGSAVRAAWHLQPPLVESNALTAEVGPVTVATSLLDHWVNALGSLPCRWLNPPYAVHRAASKLRQQITAANLGIPVPLGLSTTDVNALRTTWPHSAVAKTLADVHLAWCADPELAFVTRLIDVAALPAEAVANAPVLFQEQISEGREFRVVVVGDESFGAAIPWERRSDWIDVRMDSALLKSFEPVEVPQKVHDQLLQLLQHFDLEYCSADFLEDGSGVIHFLDLNACGAWWWVDDLHQGRITSALVARLQQLAESGNDGLNAV